MIFWTDWDFVRMNYSHTSVIFCILLGTFTSLRSECVAAWHKSVVNLLQLYSSLQSLQSQRLSHLSYDDTHWPDAHRNWDELHAVKWRKKHISSLLGIQIRIHKADKSIFNTSLTTLDRDITILKSVWHTREPHPNSSTYLNTIRTLR